MAEVYKGGKIIFPLFGEVASLVIWWQRVSQVFAVYLRVDNIVYCIDDIGLELASAEMMSAHSGC